MNATATLTEAPQHMRALQRANEVRLARAELKREIGQGSLSVAAVVLDPPWEAETMTVSDLLMSQHRWGRTRCRRFLMQVPLHENKRVGALTERQRQLLSRLLADQPEGSA